MILEAKKKRGYKKKFEKKREKSKKKTKKIYIERNKEL